MLTSWDGGWRSKCSYYFFSHRSQIIIGGQERATDSGDPRISVWFARPKTATTPTALECWLTRMRLLRAPVPKPLDCPARSALYTLGSDEARAQRSFSLEREATHQFRAILDLPKKMSVTLRCRGDLQSRGFRNASTIGRRATKRRRSTTSIDTDKVSAKASTRLVLHDRGQLSTPAPAASSLLAGTHCRTVHLN